MDELLARDNAAASNQQHAIPTRSVPPRPTRKPRKTKTAAQKNNDSLDYFTNTFAHYMSAANKVMEGPDKESPPKTINADDTQSRLIALKIRMGALDNAMKLMNTQYSIRKLRGSLLNF
ncbi:unnamed protein product [Mucor fragilis]